MFKVLVAEDDAFNRRLIIAILQEFGFEAKAAVDGEECLQILKSDYRPDILILDLMMPKRSGMEVYEQMKEMEHTQHLPVIVLSAKNEQEVIKRLIVSGVVEYMLKPFSPKELLVRITDVLEPFTKESMSSLLSSLHIPDPMLLREKELRGYGQRQFKAFRIENEFGPLCLLMPESAIPADLVNDDWEKMEQKILVFRKRGNAWKQIWPTRYMDRKVRKSA